MNELEQYKESVFERIKRMDSDGNEYWLARELQNVLGYVQWRRFKNIIHCAKTTCDNSGININEHFATVGKMVRLGSGSNRKIEDFKLSRYACYLIVQNGDSRKEVIALGQTYFAIQTRKQELLEDEYSLLSEEEKSEKKAMDTHYNVGKAVRKTIEELGNAMPEDLPVPMKSIKEIENDDKKIDIH